MNTTHNQEQDTRPEPIRVIRKINGKHQWVILKSEAEMTYNERREQHCRMFAIYA
jgi:hypothetical protein